MLCCALLPICMIELIEDTMVWAFNLLTIVDRHIWRLYWEQAAQLDVLCSIRPCTHDDSFHGSFCRRAHFAHAKYCGLHVAHHWPDCVAELLGVSVASIDGSVSGWFPVDIDEHHHHLFVRRRILPVDQVLVDLGTLIHPYPSTIWSRVLRPFCSWYS